MSWALLLLLKKWFVVINEDLQQKKFSASIIKPFEKKDTNETWFSSVSESSKPEFIIVLWRHWMKHTLKWFRAISSFVWSFRLLWNIKKYKNACSSSLMSYLRLHLRLRSFSNDHRSARWSNFKHIGQLTTYSESVIPACINIIWQ